MKRHTISLLISLLTMSYLLLVYITNHIAPDTGELLDKTMKYPPLGDFSPNALQIPTLIIFAVSSFLSWIWWPSKKKQGKITMKFFLQTMELVAESLSDYISSDSVIAAMNEEFADKQLLIATQSEMAKKLGEHREKGRHGWWNKDVCSIEDLYLYRRKALNENDHVSVINYTAMIAARESIEQDNFDSPMMQRLEEGL